MFNTKLPHNFLFFTTSILFIITLFLLFKNPPPTYPFLNDLPSQSYPSLGNPNAPIKLVLFEDFTCHQCRQFSNQILPKIEKEFIDTQLVHCTFIPILTSKESKPIFNAAHYLFINHPHLFWDFFKTWFRSPPSPNTLQQILHLTLPSLNTPIPSAKKIAKDNLLLAHQCMPFEITAPTLFINGKKFTSLNYFDIKSQIEKTL